MRRIVPVAVLLSALAWQGVAQAHIRLASPAPRYLQNDSGLKTAPCGSGTATGSVTRLAPGQLLTVTWKESVGHGGHFRIALAAKESDFVQPTSLAIPSPLPSGVLADGIQDQTGTATYNHEVKLPDQDCPKCVLQLIQVMSAGTDGTNTGTFNGNYYACADVSITAGGADASANTDGPNPSDARAELALRDLAPGDFANREVARATGGASGDASATGTGGSAGVGGATGSGGTPGSGGASGTGGGAGSSGGGVVSSGGQAGDGGKGGAGGAGGSAGSGGVTSASSGAAGGGNGGSGGSAVSSATGGSPGAGGTAGQGNTAEPGPGCSCRMGMPSDRGIWPLGAALAVLFALHGRRKRETRALQQPPS